MGLVVDSGVGETEEGLGEAEMEVDLEVDLVAN